MERRNLKSHILRVLAGKSLCEKPSAGQRTMSFPVETLKRVASGNDNEGEKTARLDFEEREPSETPGSASREKLDASIVIVKW